MPEFMDVHTSMKGVTSEGLLEAHNADLAIQDDEGVNFKHAWADPESGMVFCLSEGPNAEAVQRITSVLDTLRTRSTRCPSRHSSSAAMRALAGV